MTDVEPGMTRPWLPRALARVDDLAALVEDWDGYNAHPPSKAAVRVARSLTHMLSALFVVKPETQTGIAPQFVPTTEGGIDICWRENGYDLDVEISFDGKIGGWLHRNEDKAEVTW